MSCQSCGVGGCCGSSCGGAPPGLGAITGSLMGRAAARNFVLADRVDTATRANLGQTVQAKLNSIPLRDAKGRFAHVLGFKLIGEATITASGTAGADYPGENLAGIYQDFFLEDVSGWQYFAGISGLVIRDDVFFRAYREPQPVADDIPDAAATADYPFELYIPFTRRDSHGPMLEGAIPLSALTCRGEQAFRFNIASALPDDPNIGDYTLDALTGTLEVWVEVAYLPVVYASRPWQVESYTLSDTSGALRHCDRCHEYIAVRKLPGDDSGDLALSGYAGVTVQADGDVVFAGFSQAELDARTRYFALSDPDAEPADLPLFDAADPTIANAIIILAQARKFAGMACGTVTFNLSARGGDANTRFAHRTVAPQRRDRVSSFRSAAGLPPSPAIAVTTDMIPDKSPSPESTVLIIDTAPAGSQPSQVQATSYSPSVSAGTAKPYDLI